MNRSRSHRRPYARTRRSSSSPHGGAPRLADLAGRAPAPAVDALEPRQLLFSLTITPDLIDPFTGVGQATVYFGYVLPFLVPLEGDITEIEEPPDPIFERFDDVLNEDLPPLGSPRVNVPSGTIMPDSNLRFTHNIQPATDFQFREEAGSEDEGRLFVRLDQTERFTMQVTLSQETTTQFLGLQRFEFEVQPSQGSIQGLNLNNTRLTLRFLGQVVATFTGTALGQLNTSSPGTGVGRFEIILPNPGAPGEFLSFDEIEISAIAGPNDAFFIDNVGWDIPGQGVAFTGFSSQQFIDNRIFGARLTIAGPVGASVEVLDLYGRDMRPTIMLGIPPGSEVTIVDTDGNGVPNFNDGIGRFILSGFDETSTMTIIGGPIEQGFSEDADFNEGGPQGFNFTLVDNILGLYDDFEQARFGYGLSADPDNPAVIGLPPGPGSVVVGSPFVRPNQSASAYNPLGFAADVDFNVPDQGVFARGGQNVGSVAIHGIVHGSSRFDGFVERVALGYFPGSMTVKGDLGEFIVGSDAGMWVREDDVGFGPLVFRTTKTAGQLVVERTLGEVAIAGRSLMDITVIGDMGAPGVRPPRDIYQYWEREYMYGINIDAEERDTILATFFNADFKAFQDQVLPGDFPTVIPTGQSPWFGDSYFRNDSILSAEFVGSPGTAVEIRGELDSADPKNTAEDLVDVYAFAVDGTRLVVLEGRSTTSGNLVRIVDSDGRTLAAQEFDDAFFTSLEYHIEWTPPAPGVYYLVLTSQTPDGNAGTNNGYVMTLSGLAPVTFGAYRTGASSGRPADFTMSPLAFAPLDNAINLLSGSMGAVRVGTAYINGSGDETDPTEIMNPILTADDGGLDDEMDWAGGSISVDNGGLYQLLAGSDIEGVNRLLFGGQDFSFPTLVLGGDLGVVVTGLSPVIGVDPVQGDLRNVNLEIGGRIGMLDIRAGIGHSQDGAGVGEADIEFDGVNSVNIRTGLRTGNGDIGFIRVGGHVYANRMNVFAPGGSTIGGFAISQDIEFSEDDAFWGISGEGRPAGTGVNWTLGAGSDVRFVAIPRIDLESSVDVAEPIRVNQAIEVIDDSGARVRITVRGGGGTTGNLVGLLRTMPINGSEGVAIGEIEVNLAPGLGLEIEGIGGGAGDIISIGRIQILDGDSASNVRLIGNVEIDVWQIFQAEGELDRIENLTPNGDIVAIDVPAINTVRIERGDLGRTQLPTWGPSRIGPFLGIGGDAGGEGAEFAPFEIEGPLDDNFNGNLYRPVGDTGFGGDNAYLSDIGSPVDPWLNGLIARTGSIARVEVGGAVGDVIAVTGDVGLVHANFQERGVFGAFNGIIGNIYGNDVIEVNIGDGMLARGDTPIAQASIVADDDIFRILGVNQSGATLSGVIAAGNNVLNDRAATFDTDGIELIRIDGGRYLFAEILTGDLNSFWDDITGYVTPAHFGDVELITGNDTDFIRSDVTTLNLQTFRMATGVFDASQIQTLESATLIEAAMFMNSTARGSLREFRESAIIVADNLADLRTTDSAGDIQDTRIDVVRSITGAISAFNIERSTIDADNTINRIDAVNLRGSSIIAGRLLNLDVENGIRTSAINISGLLQTITADSIHSTSINVTGPDGRLNNITVRGLFDGSILSTGPVGRLESTGGDIRGRLETRTARGTVDTIVAARDIDLETDISASLNTLRAGRHIGNIGDPKVLLVRDDLQTVDVSGGALYSDIRVGDNITGTVTIGSVPARPALNLVGDGSVEAFGRINRVSVTGDFGGSVVSHSGGIGLVDITDGSFLPGGAIIAWDGDIAEVRITRGHLLGNIHADNILFLVQVTASDDGVFGDIGINPALSGFRPSADPNRHELPPGVAVRSTGQGPTISAGRNIGRVNVSGGSVFETTFIAGQAIGTIDIAGSFMNDNATSGFNNFVVAGNSIARVSIGGNASDLLVLAGIIDLGPDGRPGGTGEDADLVKSGRVGMPGEGDTGVFIGGNARDVSVAAGIVAGADGVYNTADDRHSLGLSYISNVIVGGSVTDVSAHADSNVENVSAGITTGGHNTPVVGNVLEPVMQAPGQIGTVITPGAPFNFTHGADSGTIEYSGPGTLVWDAAGGRLVLINTTMQTDVTVTSESGHLSSFRIISNDDASVGRLEVNSSLRGASDIYIDGYAREIVIDGEYSGSGSIGVGNDIQLFRVNGAFRTSGTMSGVFVREFDINGPFGGSVPTSPGTFISPTVTIFSAGTVSIDGGFRGVLSADRNISSVTIGGEMFRGFVRSGGSIDRFEAGSVREAHISARNNIGSVDIDGDAFRVSIIAGGDLGRDARFGGVGPARDVISTGSVGPVNIGGSFAESDIVAGLLRGPDGFYGTSDDIAASGRSNIGLVTIGGTSLGSTRDTESYGVYATGTIAGVTAAGQGVTQRLNFRVERQDTRPVPIQVTDLSVAEDARQYTARLTFNQPMNASTLVDGLIVNEIRAPGVSIRLQEGLDYDLEYDASTETALVHFRRAVTDRDLPASTGVPGPGIYRFTLDPNVVRAQVNSARMDGDGDGFADDRPYSADTIVGDAGDKVNNQQLFVPDGAGGEKQIDFYGAIDLDIVLDDNFISDSLPDANTVFTIRGAIGDHPDAEAEIFSFSGDVDVYKITLQAGQILRLSPSEGAASETERWLYSSSGVFQSPFAVNAQSVALPTGFPLSERGSLATGQNYLITVTDQYYLVVGNDPLAQGSFLNPGAVNDFPPSPRRVGSYAFDLEVFDDGDSGFSAPTDAGNGKRIPNAPPPAAFNGPDGMPGTGDDIAEIISGNFTFTVNRQTGVVTGVDGEGVMSQRLADGRQLQTIDSNLGGRGAAGLPGNVTPDVDIFHLNDRQTIQAGTRLRVTVRLTDEGSDLGNRQLIPELQRDTLGIDFLGDVQLGVFDTGASGGIADGRLVAGPSDFAPVGREPGTIASDGSTVYGYDEQGDFFVEFLAPATTTYAVYLQGVYNSEYRLEVIQQSTRPQPSAFHGPDGVAGTPDDLTNINIGRFRYTLSGGQVTGELIAISQNVFLEFNGGEIDWLEAGGLTTMLRPFAARGFGFTGAIDGVPVDRFIKDVVVENLNDIFQSAGYNVVFSRDPSQFEFQDYSTVYIADTEDPISGFFDRFFGFSQHVDVLNADRNDDAVVFAPEMSVLDYNPSPNEVRDFTDSLTAAVGRRVGELLGLRSTASTFGSPQVDLFSSSSVFETPTLGGRYIIPGFARPLSTPFDSISGTNFYLGTQHSASLLDRILGG